MKQFVERDANDRAMSIVISVADLKALKKSGKITANFFYGKKAGSRVGGEVYLLTTTGIYSLETAAKYADERIIVEDWVTISARVVKYPLDWIDVERGSLIKL